jgi:type IV pilus assembly protein PilY1
MRLRLTLFLRRVLGAVLVLLVTAPMLARADDIDIFAAAGRSSAPNVLLMLDNSANWSSSIGGTCSYADGSGGPKATNPDSETGTKMAIEKCALYNTLLRLPASDSNPVFNIGVMLFNEGNTNAGYPRSRFLPLTAANKTALLNLIRNLGINADKTNNASTAETFYEAFQMFAGGEIWKGRSTEKFDPLAFAGNRYAPVGNACTNHIIYIANGKPQDNNATALERLRSLNGDATQITYPTSYISNPDQANWADEWARFLSTGADVSAALEGKQTVRVHAIAVTGASSDGNYPNFIREIARQGGGEYFQASDATTLTTQLLGIFNGLLAVNSVFVSAALPLSTNAQGTYENQVFVGLFRPDARARPRWNGNLKQFRFAYNATAGTLDLVDSTGGFATNPTTGFLRPTAVSYWTQDSTFWVNSPQRADGSGASASDAPDGAEVERGGVAQVLRTANATTQSGRRVYTCIGCNGGTLLSSGTATQFNDANTAITSTMLGAATATERTTLINWVRGEDNQSATEGAEVAGPGSPTTVRASIHGDVLHSRPVVVSYGGTTGTVVFYGANDGTLRAVAGTQVSGGGTELWAFLPQEHFGKLKRLRDGLPEIRLPGTPPEVNATPRDYFVDGPVTVYRNAASGRTWLFIGMRRGGRFLYALDVSNPSAPRFMWKRSASDSDFGRLGQTWSAPRVVLSKRRGVDQPLLVMGGGYDATAEDATVPGTTTMGNAVFVLNAETGELLKRFDTARSVPADVALLDSDQDGFIDRGYVVDIGANVYRIDMETSSQALDASDWTFTQIGSFNDAFNTRKVFFAPDIVNTRDFAALMFGSGDREKPLQITSNDVFVVFKDRKTSKGAPASPVIVRQADLTQQIACADSDKQSCLQGASDVAKTDPEGCFVAFTGGERVVNGAATIAGNTFFSTNQPTPVGPNSCGGSLGEARTYTLPLFCEGTTYIPVTGGGLPPTPVAGYVNIDGKRVPFVIGVGRNRLDPIPPQLSVPQVKRRTFWFIENQGR